ncbi:MAG: F0F1 ATP synthase subunit delta [Candidatus Kerfeldbacteria bacterium]
MRLSPRQFAEAYVAGALEVPEGELEAFTKRFIVTLERRRQRKLLPAIVRIVGGLIDARMGVSRFKISTATTVDEAMIRSVIGDTDIVTTMHDPSLIGGAVIEHGDELIDGSVRSRLLSLKKQLLISEM